MNDLDSAKPIAVDEGAKASIVMGLQRAEYQRGYADATARLRERIDALTADLINAQAQLISELQNRRIA